MKIQSWLLPLSGSLMASIALTSFATPTALICKAALLKGQLESQAVAKFSDSVDDVLSTPKRQYVDTARALILSIENYYGPLTLKKDSIGLNWAEKKNKLFGQIGRVKSQKEFLYLISEFMLSFNDAHVSLELPSSLTWVLPLQFSFSPTEGKYFLNYFDQVRLRHQLRKGKLPPIGAELEKINGIPVEEFRNQRSAYHSAGNEITNRAIFARQLSNLRESRGIPLSDMGTKTWTFTFRTQDAKGKTKLEDVSIEYIQDGVGIIDAATVLETNPDALMNLFASGKKSKPASRQPISAMTEIVQQVDHMLNARAQVADDLKSLSATDPKTEKGKKFGIGELAPAFKLPSNFKQIKPPKPFDQILNGKSIFAGTFKHEGKTVGLLRIPSYEPENVDRMPLTLRYYITELQKQSDYLIFDQQSNPGGMVIYSDWVVRSFTGDFDNAKHVHFKVKPTASFMREYSDLVASLNKIIAQVQHPGARAAMLALVNEMRVQFELIHKAYNSGEPLSEPISMLPITKFLDLMEIFQALDNQTMRDAFETLTDINPLEQAVYTKPVYMLINEFDFSGGDATPASLRDYGRVKLIGTRTAGAGGTVEEFSSRLLQSQFIYHMTTSLMYRVGNPAQPYVENYGVHPDIEMAITKQDLLNGQKDVLQKILGLIQADMKKK